MVKDIHHYLPDVPREILRVRTVAIRSKSLSENGIDVVTKIKGHLEKPPQFWHDVGGPTLT